MIAVIKSAIERPVAVIAVMALIVMFVLVELGQLIRKLVLFLVRQ